MRILGITGTRRVLVSFDPYTGTILEKHAWLKQGEDYVGLAYDSNRNILYALSQVARNLYSIDPITRDVKLIGKLNNSNEVSGLTYDPVSDTLYTVLIQPGPPWNPVPKSELAKINASNAQVTVVGHIANGLCSSLCWREDDGQINSYIVYGGDSWDSPYKASIVSINPATAAMTAVFETAYHTIAGLAKMPGQNAFFSHINWTSRFYGEVNLNTRTITARADSGNVFVISGAMLYRDFYVAPAPNLPPCSFTDEDCLGS